MNKDYNHKANPDHIPLSASQNGTWYLGSSTFTLITQLSICTTALHDSKFKIVWELRIVKVPLALKLFYDFFSVFLLKICAMKQTSLHIFHNHQNMNSCYFQFFIRLDHIRKCFTQKEGIFVLEEFSKLSFKDHICS